MSEKKRKELAIATWRLQATNPEALRVELRTLMERDAVQVADLLEAWDNNGDRQLRKREFLIAMCASPRPVTHEDERRAQCPNSRAAERPTAPVLASCTPPRLNRHSPVTSSPRLRCLVTGSNMLATRSAGVHARARPAT